MTNRDRVLDLLRQRYPDGLDDDEIASLLGLSQRQTANAICRQLEREGLVARRKPNGKILNFYRPGGGPPPVPPVRKTPPPPSGSGPAWYDIDGRINRFTGSLPQFATELREALRQMSHPASALVTARRALEILIRPIYERVSGRKAGRSTLGTMIRTLEQSGKFPDVIIQHCFFVCNLGNIAAHGNASPLTPDDPYSALLSCLRVAEWLLHRGGASLPTDRMAPLK